MRCFIDFVGCSGHVRSGGVARLFGFEASGSSFEGMTRKRLNPSPRLLSGCMMFRVALTAPNGVVNTYCVAAHAHGCLARVTSGKSTFLNVLLADPSSAEPTNCSGLLFTLDAFHMSAAMPSNAFLSDRLRKMETRAWTARPRDRRAPSAVAAGGSSPGNS